MQHSKYFHSGLPSPSGCNDIKKIDHRERFVSGAYTAFCGSFCFRDYFCDSGTTVFTLSPNQLAIFLSFLRRRIFFVVPQPIHSSRSKKSHTSASSTRRAPRVPFFRVHVHIHENSSRKSKSTVSRGASMVTNFLDCAPRFLFRRRLSAAGHLYNVSSTAKDPLGPGGTVSRFLFTSPSSLYYVVVVRSLSPSVSSLRYPPRQRAKKLLQQHRRQRTASVAVHSRVRFFGFSEDDSGRHYAEINERWKSPERWEKREEGRE